MSIYTYLKNDHQKELVVVGSQLLNSLSSRPKSAAADRVEESAVVFHHRMAVQRPLLKLKT